MATYDRVRGLYADEGGASVGEYMVLLGTLVAGVTIGIDAFGHDLRQTVDDFHAWLPSFIRATI